jgi:hypothetical protein
LNLQGLSPRLLSKQLPSPSRLALPYIMDASISSGGWVRASGLPLFRRTLLPSELHRNKSEPAVGLEPTASALQERCPTCRASPADCSSQCWCRANSTEVQSLRPLPRAWLEDETEPAVGLEPTSSALRERHSTRRAAPAFVQGGRWELNPQRTGSQPVLQSTGVRPQCFDLDSNQEHGLRGTG